MTGEHALIDRLCAGLTMRADGVLLGPGDDAAHLDPGGGTLVATVDAFVEGVHFAPDAAAVDVGYKAAAASLSDVAAMGAEPWVLLVALCGPLDRVEALMSGVDEACAPHGVAVVGGDLTSGAQTVVSTTALGRLAAGVAPLTRAGGRPGDGVWVTGPLGGSLRGRHLRPVARVAEARALRAAGATAMLDISDGLARELRLLCAASGVGARIESAAIPVHDDARALAASSGRTALEHAWCDGEDFELLVAGVELPAVRIGTLTAEAGILVDGEPLTLGGYEHR